MVINGVLQEYTLHATLDRGSLGLPLALWLFHGPPAINGTFTTDRFHDIQCRIKEAQVLGNVALLRLEWWGKCSILEADHGVLVLTTAQSLQRAMSSSKR